MDAQNSAEIKHALRAFLREALTQFISEFMVILVQEGYTPEDLQRSLVPQAGDNRTTNLSF